MPRLVLLGEGRTHVAAGPAQHDRLIDEQGRVASGARVRRIDNDLVIEGLPDGRELRLDGFFVACAPGRDCALALEPLGAPAEAVLTNESAPIAALSDGSFLLYAPSVAEGTTAVAGTGLAPGIVDAGSVASSSGTGTGSIAAAGAGALLLGAAGMGGGGGGGQATASVPAPTGGAPAPAPPPPDTTPPSQTVTSFTVFDDRGKQSGPIANGSTTDDTTPRVALNLSDVLGDGETLRLSLDGSVVRTLTSGSSLSYEEGRLSERTHKYSATIVDAAGNVAALDLNGALPGTDFSFRVT